MAKSTFGKANRRRNAWRRERLIAQGFTPEQAQAIIDADGRARHLQHILHARADETEIRTLRDQSRRDKASVFPRPQSVPDIPTGGFESNRRRH